jgi:diguanylate cyclase
MVHRMQESEEALRWKRKFLDALEEHEQREKALSSRIRLLRRGLLGVSLAGDGSDVHLDKQLAQLRKNLRNDDRETGLELLLEQIEKSIVRLDNEKNQSIWALQQAFGSGITELQQLSLPGATRRQLKKFSRNLSERLKDPQQHAALIRQFLELLRESVAELKQQEEASNTNRNKIGLWQRVFGPSSGVQSSGDASGVGIDNKDRTPASEYRVDDKASVNLETIVQEVPTYRGDPAQDTDTVEQNDHRAAHVEQIKVNASASYSAAHTVVQSDADLVSDTEEEQPHPNALETEIVTEAHEISLEGELIRDKSGLAEPAFSYIAGHVEPLLLRILEAIHITGESIALAESVRRHIVKGLNWYDFVAVLEEILQVLRSAADDQRAEFQEFLGDVTESLAQVQAFVDNSRKHADEASASDAALDASVREQISNIASTVQDPGADLDDLKVSVQSQIGAIISSLDGFRDQRNQRDRSMEEQMNQLMDQISSLEAESIELRLHLAKQQENAMRDSLTELPNREAYNQRLRVLLEEWKAGASHERRQDDRSLCLAVADVDKFKLINDTYGHLAGDKVLKIIAKEFVSRLRETDFVARYGGEEFVIVMPDTRPADAEHALNKLREAIAAIPFHFKEQHIVITVSFGVVASTGDDTPETLFEKADRALYQAKTDGRNRVHRAR